MTIDPVWRAGHISAPLDFVPKHLTGWHGRFDDPRRRFATLYVAEHARTALREVLAPLRPSADAVAKLREVFGEGSDAERGLGTVSLAELGRRVLGRRSARTSASRWWTDRPLGGIWAGERIVGESLRMGRGGRSRGADASNVDSRR